MCYYTKVYFNIIPTIYKKYRKQNKQPKRKLVRQIILEIMLKHARYIVICTVLDELWIIKYIVCFSILYWNK
jgi:hypothetical protein